MKRIKWIIGIISALAVVILISITGMANTDNTRQQSGKLSDLEAKLLPILDQISKYTENASRQIDEYDTNDESEDPMLWSKEKTIIEVENLLKQVLADRATLRNTKNLNKLTYEGRVRRWNFNIPENSNGYDAVINVFGQLVHYFDGLSPKYYAELEEALNRKYYPEALAIFKHLSTYDKEQANDRIAFCEKYLPRFGASPESLYIRMQLLSLEASRDLGDFDQQMKLSTKDWSKFDDLYDSKIKEIKPKFTGNPYERELIDFAQRIILDTFRSPEIQITNHEKGDVEINVKGIIRTGWQLRRINNFTEKLSGKSGELIKAFDGSPKRRIDETITDQLSKPGSYIYFFYNTSSGKVDEYSETNIRYSQLDAVSKQLKNNVRVQVYHQSDAHPIEGIEVKLESSDKKKKLLETLRTDNNGEVGINLEKYAGNRFEITVTDPRFAGGKMDFYVYKQSKDDTNTPAPYDKVNFYTDRPIYRRGQKISVGVVLTHVDGKNVLLRKNVKGKIQLRANRNDKPEILAEQSYTTNQNGVAELSFDIPKDEALNDFVLTTEDKQYYVDVQDYKLNYLSIEVDSIPTGAVTGKPMEIFGHTTDLNGNPVPAKIEISIAGKERISGESRKDGTFELRFRSFPKIPYYYWRSIALELKASDALGNVTKNYCPIFSNDSTNMPLNADGLGLGKVTDKRKFTLSTEIQPYHRMPLGDLSRYRVTATLISKSTQTRTSLGELPIKGQKEFTLPGLPSGMYSIELSVVDYYENTITDKKDDYYFFAPSDTRLSGDKEMLVQYIKEDGIILYGLKDSGYLHMETFIKDKKTPIHQIEKVEGGKLYRMKVKDTEVLKVGFFTLHEGRGVSQTALLVESEDGKEESELNISGMEIKEGESFLPGAPFTRELTIKDKDNKPIKNSPVFVTVFDKAVADATSGREFWSRIIPEIPHNYFKEEMHDEVEVMGYGEPIMQVAAASEGKMHRLGSGEMKLRGMSSANDTAMSNPSEVRRNFVETAYFSVLMMTDDKGKVKLDFKLPDTQTKYVTKVYTFTPDAKKDLMKDYEFEVYSPLSIEISLPRYLHWGDQLLGEVRLMNTSGKAENVTYTLMNGDKELLRGTTLVVAKSTQSVPFSLPVSQEMGHQLTLTAQAQSSSIEDTVERQLNLLSDQYSYIVATPLSIYHQNSATLKLAKTERMQDTALLDLYFSPAHVVLSGLANEHAHMSKVPDMSLFEAVHCFAVYAELQDFLAGNAAIRTDLQSSLRELKQSGAIEASADSALRSDRQTNAKALADFYEFILDKSKLNDYILSLQTQILKFSHPRGGFNYSRKVPDPSPWLTSYVLDALRGSARRVATQEMRAAFDKSLEMIFDEMKKTHQWFQYSDYMGYRMLLHHYEKSDKQLLDTFGKKLTEQVDNARKNYLKTRNSELIRFAKYSRVFDDKGAYALVEQFIRDRSRHTMSDRELLLLELFLSSGQQAAIGDEVIGFMLKLKQGTIWEDPFTLDAVKILLRQVAPTTFTTDAAIVVQGERHHLSAVEKATGRVLLPLNALASETNIEWQGIDAEYVFGGIRYQVSEPISRVTPTGEKLKVLKEIYARRIEDGKFKLIRVTPDKPGMQGEQLVVRYLVETAQDLSLVTIKDERPAGAEPGYVFEGYGVSNRVWWSYGRRETADHLFIDYLPRGKHVFEIEATATLGGHFAFGPAQVQSYYAPEYTGNSNGGYMSIRPNNPDASFVLMSENGK